VRADYLIHLLIVGPALSRIDTVHGSAPLLRWPVAWMSFFRSRCECAGRHIYSITAAFFAALWSPHQGLPCGLLAWVLRGACVPAVVWLYQPWMACLVVGGSLCCVLPESSSGGGWAQWSLAAEDPDHRLACAGAGFLV